MDMRSKRITSIEALVRWEHPRFGLLMPDSFIARCEESGSIRRLTEWTLERAISDSNWLAEQGVTDISTYVNLSAQLLGDARVVSHFCKQVPLTGVRMGVEITERSVIADPALGIAAIERLRAAGYAIAIDDYGSGLSSLTYLKQIPADELKIDKSFICTLDTSHRDPLIVRSTIDLAHALGMAVTAEGVESPAAYALLGVMGCDFAQGYLIGRPMALDELLPFITSFDDSHFTFPRDRSLFNDARFWKRA